MRQNEAQTPFKFQKFLEGEILKARALSRKGWRLLTSKANPLALGNTKAFRKSSFQKGKNAHVIILLDGSGSMIEERDLKDPKSRFEIALEAVATLHKALLNQPHVKVTCALFPSPIEGFSLTKFVPKPNMQLRFGGRRFAFRTCAYDEKRVKLGITGSNAPINSSTEKEYNHERRSHRIL